MRFMRPREEKQPFIQSGIFVVRDGLSATGFFEESINANPQDGCKLIRAGKRHSVGCILVFLYLLKREAYFAG
jgi:hypothetical protein